MTLMFSVLVMVFVAEMGDKTQFLLVAMVSKYRLRDIMIGTALAIILLNALAIGFGAVIGDHIPKEYISIAVGLAFFYFAFSSLGEDDKEDDVDLSDGKRDMLKVFTTFFLAELGDKTQLAALAVSAERARGDAIDSLMVWLGACMGLYLADMLGLVVGLLLGKKLPRTLFERVSFLTFAVLGGIKLLSGLEVILYGRTFAVIMLTLAVSALFAFACFIKTYSEKRR